MSLSQILFILITAIGIGAFLSQRSRNWSIFLLSILSTYLFQPLVPLRNFDFWYPTASIILTAATWLIVCKGFREIDRESVLAGLISTLIVILVVALPYIPIEPPWIPSSSPEFSQIVIFLLGSAFLAAALSLVTKRQLSSTFFILFLLVIFLILKSEPIALWVSERLRLWQGQSISLASTLDLHWLGFSYISFRLIHTLRDQQTGRLPETNLREFMTYVLFFPALVAGPIDRLERFIDDLRKSDRLSSDRTQEAARKIVLGLLKKFIIADALALFALNPIIAPLTSSTGWSWILLYAYSFRLFLDFSGYTDIAIGIGLLMGIELPENFDQPYLKSNMTTFWNSWHITLARWFRSYFFNPMTRWLRGGPLRNLPGLIIFIGQVATMVLIGLWHGVTWNFAIWGLWHGIGLFIHNRWVNYLRGNRGPALLHRVPPMASRSLGILLTFHYTALGWVWFALPEVSPSLSMLRMLFGFTG